MQFCAPERTTTLSSADHNTNNSTQSFRAVDASMSTKWVRALLSVQNLDIWNRVVCIDCRESCQEVLSGSSSCVYSFRGPAFEGNSLQGLAMTQ
eukprot:68822-Alexandrium_andersonii.AAC.1